jgi:hypothetical protein
MSPGIIDPRSRAYWSSKLKRFPPPRMNRRARIEVRFPYWFLGESEARKEINSGLSPSVAARLRQPQF